MFSITYYNSEMVNVNIPLMKLNMIRPKVITILLLTMNTNNVISRMIISLLGSLS